MSDGDWISLTLTIVTTCMMGATVWLAWATRVLSKDTAAATKQADRHHQESLRPFCVIEFLDANREFPFGRMFDSERRSVRGTLHNKGKGLAKDVLIYLNARRGSGDAYVFQLTRPVVASGLIGAEESTALEFEFTQVDTMQRWDAKQSRWIEVTYDLNDVYEVVLEYKDVFDNTFRTVHSRGIWTEPLPDITDASVQKRMMVRPSGPTPVFLAGRQTVRTLVDAPPPGV